MSNALSPYILTIQIAKGEHVWTDKQTNARVSEQETYMRKYTKNDEYFEKKRKTENKWAGVEKSSVEKHEEKKLTGTRK